MTSAKQEAVKAAMGIADDIATGQLDAEDLEAEAVAAVRELFSTVVGPGDALWELQCDVTRQVLTAGGIAAAELTEWVAVQRSRESQDVDARAEVQGDGVAAESDSVARSDVGDESVGHA